MNAAADPDDPTRKDPGKATKDATAAQDTADAAAREAAEKKSLLEVVARYSASRFYRQFLGVFTAFLRPKLLNPHDFGLWNLLRIIPDYVSYSHLGLHSAMRLNVPRALAAGREEEAAELEDTAWSGTLALNGLISIVLLLLGAFGAWEPKVRWGLAAMGVTFLILSVSEYKMNHLKAHEGFGILTATNFYHITLNCLLTVTCLLLWGIYGLFVALPAAHLLTVWYMYRRDGRTPRLRFHLSRCKEMVRFGLPLMALGVIIMMVQTSDRIMISLLLGNEQLGYYGISNMIMGFLMNVPGAAREILEPRLMRELDHQDRDALAFRYLLTPLLQTSYLMPLMVGPVVLCLPSAVSLLLPRYTQGVSATQILAVGGFFFAHVVVLRGIIAARNQQGKAFGRVVVALLVNIIGSVAAVRAGYGIAGVAVSSTLAFLLVYILLLGMMIRDLGLANHPDWPSCRWRLMVPFPAMVLLLSALSLVAAPSGWWGVPIAGVKTVVFLSIMWVIRKFAKLPK